MSEKQAVLPQTNLYLARIRVNLCVPPRVYLVQEILIDGESMIWVDGVDIADPLLLPKKDVSDLESIGTFADFLSQNVDAYLGLVQAFPEDSYSPSVMARAILGMKQKPHFTYAEMMSLVLQEGQAIRELERRDRKLFDACMTAP